MTFEAPYDFATLKAAILKVNPEQSKPVNRGEVIQAWSAAGATDKTTRNKALKQYAEEALILGTPMKVQLGDLPIMINPFSLPSNPHPAAKPDYFDWVEGQELFVAQITAREKGKWHKHPAGFYFKFINKGSGTKSPNAGDATRCHYEGKLLTGQVFDSSYSRQQPADFAPQQVIKSWFMMLQLLRGGDVVEILAPPALAYGANGSPPTIPPMSFLLFKIAVLEVLDGKGKDASEAVSALELLTGKKYADL